ncbi:hypothetical protein EUTSA_v10024173mg [Eutrema salsugineum]|uniref:Uncharacterized protein n=1 Tax=Eutrema salsugineum TaxID=72664 RepID=V4KI51_EUTSA|nr:hypothetical protein EUTSA_v10024173mg [Eutrema salsugineum]
MGIAMNSHLSQLFSNGRWAISTARSEKQVLLQSHLSSLLLNDSDDYYEWVVEDRYGLNLILVQSINC